VVIQRDRLAEIPHQAISRLVKEYREYPGEGYCEFEDEILVCIASIPQGYSEKVLGLTLARAISIVDPREGKVYLYVEDSSLRSIENIVRKTRKPGDAGEAFQAVLEYIYNEYRAALEAIGSSVDIVEDMIEREELLAVVRETYRLRRILIDFRRGLRNYIQMLREIHSDQNMARYIKNLGRLLELIDELSIGLETLEIYREMLISIRETHATLVGVKLNEVVKRLTAITLVLMIPTLIASIYGMNFDRSYPLNMPELSWSFGYIYALGLMVVSSIAGYLILKARGWF